MLKLRIKFSKDGVMRYVGHLDLMRYFQKAIARAKLPVAYSAGFNPHQIISFAAPLGLGFTSTAEYFDMEMTEAVSEREVIDALNAQMVEGMSVSGAAYLADNAKNAMSIVAACDYIITPLHEDFDLRIFEAWEGMPEILMTKKTKKSENTVDIRPLIHSFAISGHSIGAKIAAGSAANLKPADMMQVLSEKLGYEWTGDDFLYQRTEIYAKDENGAFISLLDFTGEK